ncbi:rCG51249, partial [Rattus norvegicus]
MLVDLIKRTPLAVLACLPRGAQASALINGSKA